jgi:hypothetical protein
MCCGYISECLGGLRYICRSSSSRLTSIARGVSRKHWTESLRLKFGDHGFQGSWEADYMPFVR